MATQFSRLYRELCHSDPNGPAIDIHYTKERKGVLASLGHSVNIHKDVTVQLCKHHGKGARRRAPEAKLKAIGIEDSLRIKKEREIRQLSMKTNKVHELTNKIQRLLQADKFVSKNLWAQYDQIYGEAGDSTPPPIAGRLLKSGANTLPKMPKKEPEKKGVQKRTKSSVRVDFSKNKWSRAERDKLNTIYWELKRPNSKSLALWNNYFMEFASIFCVYFSGRSIDSVIKKVKYMYSTRQFAEPGESAYWQSVTDTCHGQSHDVSHLPDVRGVLKSKLSKSSST
jgi:hypothetical protein